MGWLNATEPQTKTVNGNRSGNGRLRVRYSVAAQNMKSCRPPALAFASSIATPLNLPRQIAADILHGLVERPRSLPVRSHVQQADRVAYVSR